MTLASVQNAAQTDRERGVALWVLENDGTRPDGWQTPFHAPGYLAGLWDFEGTAEYAPGGITTEGAEDNPEGDA